MAAVTSCENTLLEMFVHLGSTVALNGNNEKKIVVNSPNGSEPKGLLKGSFAEELKSLLSVVFLESEPLPDGLKGSELKKLSVELCKRRKQVKNP